MSTPYRFRRGRRVGPVLTPTRTARRDRAVMLPATVRCAMTAMTSLGLTRQLGWICSLQLLWLGELVAGSGVQPKPSDAMVDFVRDVQPIFRRHCHTCHGADVQEGGLRLDRRKDAFAGGDGGKVLVPGNPGQSRLLQLVQGLDPQGRTMPPKDDARPLKATEIRLLKNWVEQGARWPENADVAGQRTEASRHWAFQPIRRPPTPSVDDQDWCRNPIDRFILARLESHGLGPTATATPRALVRRAYLDVLGLPPSPQTTAVFLQDHDRFAWESLVDAILSYPQLGERWGRHWLDLVRYADTNGYEGDGEKPFAWRYRDYVIDALNADKPYDDFVREQLAGDEIPNASMESVLATGFLRIGPWDAERGASVQPSEVTAERYNQLDDMVSTTSIVFLGLTIGCARCHDHKFDPISARDYYSLVSIFHPLQRPHKFRTELAVPAAPPKWRNAESAPDFPLGYFLQELSPQSPDTHLLIRGSPNQPGAMVSPAVPVALVNRQPAFVPPSQFTSRRRLSLANWMVDESNPLTARVIVNRVWQTHFGQGLVRTSSDFGRRSAACSHPQLLDWLADWFMRDARWSLKNLHRLIMTSSTYRMGTRWNAASAEIDVDNRLLWHFPFRRLEMEAIRDSMLAASGQLNLQMHGPGMFPQVPAAAKRSGYDPGNVWKPLNEREASRRTVYAFLKRTFIPPLFDVLDFCDTARSVERRNVSTVAPQALTLLNGEFVNRQARHFADRLRRDAGAVPEVQITLAYQLALGRSPDRAELLAMSEYLRIESQKFLRGEKTVAARTVGIKSHDTPPEPRTPEIAGRWALIQLCRVLFNLNEFVYAD